MHISTGMIEDKLRKEYEPELRVRGNIRCTGARLLSQAHILLEPEQAYICPLNMFESLAASNADGTASLLIFVGEAGDWPKEDSSFANSIFVGMTDVVEVFRCIVEYYLTLSDWSSQLKTAVLEGASLEKLSDIGAMALNNPFIILDPMLNLLAYSKNIAPEDESFQKTIELGYTPMEIVDKITTQRKSEDMQNRARHGVQHEDRRLYVRSADAINEYHKLVRNVFDEEGNVRAGIYMHCSNEPETMGLCDLLDAFADTLTYYFRAKDVQKPSVDIASFDAERYMLYILENRFIDDITPTELAARMSMPLDGEFRMFVLCASESVSDQYVLRQTRDSIPNARCVLFENNVVGLLGCKYKYASEDEQISAAMKRVTALSKSFDSAVGVGLRFSNMLDMKTAYQQALKAAEIGERLSRSSNPWCSFKLRGGKNGRVYDYEELYLHHMVLCCGNETGLSSLCVPQLYNLLEFDKHNHTDHYKVLYVYLKYDRKTIEVADALHMHRNNVNYRIRRIEELFGLDLSDHNMRLRLQISFRVLDLM